MRLETAHSPLCAALDRQVRDRGSRTAVVSLGEEISVPFAELGSRTAVWASRLRAAGVGPGVPAGLAAGNVLAFPELFFALRSIGAPVVTLDELTSSDGVRALAERMGTGWLLHRRPDLDGTPLEGAPDPSVRLLRLGDGSEPPRGTDVIKLTSGSTLAPRGACFTEEALVEGVGHILRGMELGAADVVLVSIPLSHSYGFDNGVLSLALGGTPLVLQPDVLPGALIKSIRDSGVTFFPAVPALVRALGRVEWPKGHSLRSVACASAPLPREAAAEFLLASGVPVRQFYGATESGGIAFESRPGDAEAEGSVGFPLPGVRVEIGSGGGVRIHSKANRFAILPAEDEVPAWVETGDRGELSSEGRLRLLGRASLAANVGGFKVDLGALDAFLRGLPGVEEAAAVAVDDVARGQRVVAYVEARAQSAEALLGLCRARLTAREMPSEIRVRERLPRTERGKLDRAALAGGGL